MKPFSTTSLLPHPVEDLWLEIRDRLPELVPRLADIRAVVPIERSSQGAVTRIVNRWEADPKIPHALAAALKVKVIDWIDRAEWNESTHECHWRIEPGFFAERIRCSGSTLYETAMGGRGTRITFRGELNVTVGSILGSAVAAAIESFVTAVIPRNFQALANAAASSLAGKGGRPLTR